MRRIANLANHHLEASVLSLEWSEDIRINYYQHDDSDMHQTEVKWNELD